MNDSTKKYYFSIIKLCCMMILIVYYVYSNEKSLHDLSVEWFLLAVVLATAIGAELLGSPEQQSLKKIVQSRSDMARIKLILLVAEAVLTMIIIMAFHDSKNGLLLLPFVILDIVTFLQVSYAFGILSFLGIFLRSENPFLYFVYCLFLFIIYFQNYIIIEKYRKYLGILEEEEYNLKDSIHSQSTLYKEELAKSSLSFENKMLEEKARLSQALHDKLGHSINGSIYQLEACKVLMEKDPQESKKIIQGVIDNLRTSMDEIRSILRREKPDKKRMAQLQLIGLCEDCKEKYGIQAEFSMEGDSTALSESHWDVILDNTFEAVTNALKYSQCTKINIEIAILHKVVRCSITDNGVGCTSVKEGMGIQGMLNRTRKVNGIIDINSNHGFRINMLLPLGE